MKKLFLIIGFLTSSQLFSQQVTQLITAFNRDSFKFKFVGVRGGDYYFSKKLIFKDEWQIARCDSNLRIVKEFKAELHQKNAIINLIGKDSIRTLGKESTPNNSFNLVSHYYTADGKALGSKMLATCEEKGEKKKKYRNFIEFEYALSPEGSKTLWYYGGNRVEEQNTFINVKVYRGHTDQEVYSKKITFPYKDELTSLERAWVSEDGGVLFLMRVFKKELPHWNEANIEENVHNQVLFYYDPAKDALQERELFTMETDRVSFRVAYNTALKRYDLAGFYTSDGVNPLAEQAGISYYSYSPANNTLDKKTVGLDTSLRRKVLHWRTYKKGRNPNDLIVDDIRFLKDGEICLVGHQYYPIEGTTLIGRMPSASNPSWAPYSNVYSGYTISCGHRVFCIILDKSGQHIRSEVFPAMVSNDFNFYTQFDKKTNSLVIITNSGTGASENATKLREMSEYNKGAAKCKDDDIEPNKLFVNTVSLTGGQTKTLDMDHFVLGDLGNLPDRKLLFLRVQNGDNMIRVVRLKY